MKILVKAALLATSMALLPIVAAAPSFAAGISVDFGNVAYGYRDGYWDKNHHWNNWRNSDEAASYRTKYQSQYHDWKHDRDPDQGWHNR